MSSRHVVFAVLALLLCGLASGAVLAGEQYPYNERLMYGGIRKSAAMLAADEEFIASIDALGKTREEAAEHFVKRGWEGIEKGDLATAMKRFNQAWLLAPDYFRVYWGFAVAVAVRDHDTDGAMDLFEKALSMRSDVAGIYIDCGRILEEGNRPREAVAMFEKGLAIEPGHREAYIGMIRAWVAMKDVETAILWIRQGIEKEVFSPEESKQYEAFLADMQ